MSGKEKKKAHRVVGFLGGGAKRRKVEPLEGYATADSSTISIETRHSLNIYPISKNEVSTAEGPKLWVEKFPVMYIHTMKKLGQVMCGIHIV